MFKKITAALVAISLLTTPVFAADIKKMSPEEIAQSAMQKHVMLRIQPTFDEQGTMEHRQALTRIEAIMLAQIERECYRDIHERLAGKSESMVRKILLGLVSVGIGGGIGAVVGGFTSSMFGGLKFGNYAAQSGGSGAGSGVMTGAITNEQMTSIAIGYCQILDIQGLSVAGDRRLKMIRAIPVVGLKSKRLPVDWNTSSSTNEPAESPAPSDTSSEATNSDDNEADAVPPPPPL